MTDNFIAFFYRERLLVAVVSMLIVAGGILALRRLNVDAFPDVTPVQVEIDTEAEGLAPEEVERQITFPIENEMNGISGVTRVESVSKFGLSVVVVYFSDDTDMYFAREQVFQRLANAKENIPSGFEPTMGPITTGTGLAIYEILNDDPFNFERVEVPVAVAFVSNTGSNLPGLGQSTVGMSFAPLSTVTTASASWRSKRTRDGISRSS